MSAIQLEFKLHYISTIDPGAAGIWAVIINDVKAIMDNNRSAINFSNKMIDFIYVFFYLSYLKCQLLFTNQSFVMCFKLLSFFCVNLCTCFLFFCLS